MIHRIGCIVQGPNDLGFLMGLRQRMGCDAELVQLAIRGANKLTLRSQAQQVAQHIERERVDIVIRLTDADDPREPWQQVKRTEHDRFPASVASLVVVGVTTGGIESWITADRPYLEASLACSLNNVTDARELISLIKEAMRKHPRKPDYAQVMADLVAKAEVGVFRSWLDAQPSLQRFYMDCRRFLKQNHPDCNFNDEITN